MGSKKLQVAILLFKGLTSLDAIGPYEVLQVIPNVEVVFVAQKPGPIPDTKGYLQLTASASFEDVPRPDIIVIPGGIETEAAAKDEKVLSWIRKVHETTLYTTSVCTGSLILGAAGLLKGLHAASHWSAYEDLAKTGAIPTEKRFVREGKIITAAGVSTGIDMALSLAALISDELTAKTVQLCIEYDPQPPYDAGSIQKAGPEVLANAASWVGKLRELQG